MKSTASAWSRVVKPIVDALADSAHACEPSGLPEARTLSYAAIVALTYLWTSGAFPDHLRDQCYITSRAG